ncbi:F0F1 ATP synthase subunit delta [Nitrosophilus kaiyonis]|uniref:F0F1 ATP synthase subunit delta n=1 Tax=Nitrosophilus kaiyonis TaxID=2930200 RepID=UPI0024938805|nr:F0F1 ATP synthase subunit delta [Nitrosophilus kaiyonis]
MEELIAKRYVKALVDSSSIDELEKYNSILKALSSLFKEKEIKDILASPEIKEEKKCELLLNAIKEEDKKIKNFLKLLAEKKRISLIPDISRELQNQLYVLKNEYEGKVYSETELNDKELKEIEDSLSKKVGAKIVLKKSPQKYDGIKVEVDSLGIEISFSRSKIKNQIIEHILKAI